MIAKKMNVEKKITGLIKQTTNFYAGIDELKSFVSIKNFVFKSCLKEQETGELNVYIKPVVTIFR